MIEDKQVGAAGQGHVAQEGSGGGVHVGQGRPAGAGGRAGGHGDAHQLLAVGQQLAGVEHLAATDGDHGITGAVLQRDGNPAEVVFAAIVALAERGPIIALLVVVLTVIVGSFDGDVLQPLVMGKAVNLHPLAIVIAIAAGSIALGIVGALIAVPIAGAIYGVAKYLTNRDPEHPYLPAASPPAPS